jgi:diguanylate cyclase (GGDEF)-like protein
MPSCVARLLTAFLLLAGMGSAGAAREPILLQDAMGHIEVGTHAETWVDTTGEAGIEKASAATFLQSTQPDAIFKLGPDAALWLRFKVARPPNQRQDWLLEVPMPMLDHVTMYQREQGRWRAEAAGDTLAVASWPEPGRHPRFTLDHDQLPGEVRDIYVRIRHTTAANFPLQLVTRSSQIQRHQLEYLALGTAFGALLLLIAGCLARGWAYRDPVFAWYAGYAVLTSLAVAAYTGIAAHVLWPAFGALGDAPMPMLACAAVGTAMFFVRNVLGLRRRLPFLDRAMLYLGLAGLAVALLPPLLPKTASMVLVGGYIALAALSAVLVAAFAWSRGDPVAKWVLAAYVPMVLAVLAAVARTFGLLPVSALATYAIVASIALEVPLLLVALFMRAHDRHSAQVREQALSTHDALTGLLARHLFHDRLDQVVARFRRDGENAAVMYIELVNHQRIREVFGTSVAEQSLLRSVIKLRRLLRDVDTVSRIGEARFGVILEGATARSSVTERATRLIAGGLMPLPGLKPDVTLQFHVAALLLSDRPMEAKDVEAALDAQLARMSHRTRRPIRFIEREETQGSVPDPDASLFPEGDAAGNESEFAPIR